MSIHPVHDPVKTLSGENTVFLETIDTKLFDGSTKANNFRFNPDLFENGGVVVQRLEGNLFSDPHEPSQANVPCVSDESPGKE